MRGRTIAALTLAAAIATACGEQGAGARAGRALDGAAEDASETAEEIQDSAEEAFGD